MFCVEMLCEFRQIILCGVINLLSLICTHSCACNRVSISANRRSAVRTYGTANGLQSKRPIVKTSQFQVKTSHRQNVPPVKTSQGAQLKTSHSQNVPGECTSRNRSRIHRPKWLTGMRFSLPVRSL